MTIKLDAKLVGDLKLTKAFNNLERSIRGKIARKALRAGGKVVLKEAKKQAAAVDDPTTPSDIMKRVARLLKLRAMKRSRKHIGVRIMTPTREQLGIERDHYPPAHIELGTSKTPAHPYLRNSLKSQKLAAMGAFRRELWAGIRALASRSKK